MIIRQNTFRQIFEESVSVKISPVKILRYMVYSIHINIMCFKTCLSFNIELRDDEPKFKIIEDIITTLVAIHSSNGICRNLLGDF